MVGRIVVLAFAMTAGGALSAAPPEPGTHGHYLVLTSKPHTPPPFLVVDLVYGPRDESGGLWWQLSLRKEDRQESQPLLRLRCLSGRDPLEAGGAALSLRRYILRIPSTGETLEYRNVRTGGPLLPGWRDFERTFLPLRARGSGEEKRVAQTAEYLGHVLTLKYVGTGVPWEAWDDVRTLDLDPELLVGTSRNFRDAEGHRLPQAPERTNYTYVPFKAEEYSTMMDAGINSFIVDETQFPRVRGEPVFHIRAGGKALSYPADLYRSNYLGPVMFLDEPGIIMVGDENIHDTLRYFSDAAAVLRKRVRESTRSSGHYGAFLLERSLLDAGVNLGDLRIEQHDFPAWETLFETAHYQLEVGQVGSGRLVPGQLEGGQAATGLAGIVHEGRYQLAPFDEAVERFSGTPRKHTAREMLRYHFGILRGAARAFGKHWGTSIYGQCDPAISPEAITLAYDMGARYVWFWTSDHDHHVPWPEQLELARTLKEHAAMHPRASLSGPPPVLDLAIAIPYGYFPSLENLWWVRCLDKEGKNDASGRYRRLMKRLLDEYHRALDAGVDFDIVVDGGSIERYRKVVRLSDEE